MKNLPTLLSEEKNGEFYVLTPRCPKCEDNKIMSGFFYEFYKDPTFSMTESYASFTWNKVYFMCPKCQSRAYLSEEEIATMNKYPLDKINFPPGFDSKNMKVTKLTSK